MVCDQILDASVCLSGGFVCLGLVKVSFAGGKGKSTNRFFLLGRATKGIGL